MKAVLAIIAMALLCSVTEARFSSWQHGTILRGLLQINPMQTAYAAQPATLNTQPVYNPALLPAQAAFNAPYAAQPAVATADPTAAAVPTSDPRLYMPGMYGRDGQPVVPMATVDPATGYMGAAEEIPPPSPNPGNNLMVVMTVLAQEAKDIYKNQQAVKQELARAAGVGSEQVFFYKQTANPDRTGNTAMSLIMNIECGYPEACYTSYAALYNTRTQALLTNSLARANISLLPGTFQVQTVPGFGDYKGNATLYEDKALLASQVPTSSAASPGSEGPEGMPRAPPTVTKPAPNARPGMPLGNFSIPGFTLDNSSLSNPILQAPAPTVSTFVFPGQLPMTVPGLQQQRQPLLEERLRNSARSRAANALPLLGIAVALLFW